MNEDTKIGLATGAVATPVAVVIHRLAKNAGLGDLAATLLAIGIPTGISLLADGRTGYVLSGSALGALGSAVYDASGGDSVVRQRILHNTEAGTSAPRDDAVIDTIVVHTTDTEGFAREVTAQNQATQLRYIERARDFGGISSEDAISLLAEFGGRAKSMSDATALTLTSASNERTASWHYCVASKPEGNEERCEVVEVIDPSRQAHHVGSLGLRTNLRSIGIENMYPGYLPRTLDEREATERYASWGWNAPSLLAGPDGVRRWYTPQPPSQRSALFALCLRLVERYPTIWAIADHHQFAPERRMDPDPPISLVELRSFLTSHTGRTYAASPAGPRGRT